MKNSISNFKKQNERRDSRTRSMMGNSELPKYAGDWGDEVPKQKSAAELSDWAYFWKRWDHTIIFWGGLFLLFCLWLGLWRYCGSLVGMEHFFRNGLSRDGDFAVKKVPRGEFGGQKLVLKNDGIEYVFRWCPRGNFRMGSPESEKGRKDEETPHRVTFSSGFWILETEITEEMWDSVMRGENLSEKKSKLPVWDVSWSDADAFCEKLGRMLEFRVKLPTEAQWEYACRAENSRPFCGGEPDRVAWHAGNSGGKVHPVKKKRGNLWFIYDMHGNAAEWCRDRYEVDYYVNSPEKDPLGPRRGRTRVVRGGSFMAEIPECRAAARESQLRVRKAGFRIVLEFVPKKKKKE